MKVCGFTIVRNAIRFDYPVEASIRSLLPLCDRLVVAVGNSDDGTRALIQSLDPLKIEILDTIWDDQLRQGGAVLAQETNKAMDAIGSGFDWAIYLQADEVLHEADYPAIRLAMEQHQADLRVEGILFKYRHFYGSYDYVGASRRWYRNEVRIIRPDIGIRSYKDAQGFRRNGHRLMVKCADAHVYHYGWVKPPELQQAKQESFHKMWHDDQWMKKNIPVRSEFDYSGIDLLEWFHGTHPQVMQGRIADQNWKFDHDISRNNLSIKNRILHLVEGLTGWRPGEYRNYKVLR